jgi:hypothetical protein
MLALRKFLVLEHFGLGMLGLHWILVWEEGNAVKHSTG